MTDTTDADGEADCVEEESRPKYGIRSGAETVEKTRAALGTSQSKHPDDSEEAEEDEANQ